MILQQLWDEWRGLEADIAAVTKEIEMIAAADEGCRRLLAIPGVGPLVATARVAVVADAASSDAAILLHGSASSHGDTRPAVNRRCSECRSAATVTCADCSSTAQGRPVYT
jgi:transposase